MGKDPCRVGFNLELTCLKHNDGTYAKVSLLDSLVNLTDIQHILMTLEVSMEVIQGHLPWTLSITCPTSIEINPYNLMFSIQRHYVLLQQQRLSTIRIRRLQKEGKAVAIWRPASQAKAVVLPPLAMTTLDQCC